MLPNFDQFASRLNFEQFAQFRAILSISSNSLNFETRLNFETP